MEISHNVIDVLIQFLSDIPFIVETRQPAMEGLTAELELQLRPSSPEARPAAERAVAKLRRHQARTVFEDDKILVRLNGASDAFPGCDLFPALKGVTGGFSVNLRFTADEPAASLVACAQKFAFIFGGTLLGDRVRVEMLLGLDTTVERAVRACDFIATSDSADRLTVQTPGDLDALADALRRCGIPYSIGGSSLILPARLYSTVLNFCAFQLYMGGRR